MLIRPNLSAADNRRIQAMLYANNNGGNLRQMLRDGSAFYAPRTSSITQTRGSGTPTITRATVATVTNNDGYLVTALSGEIRQQGARRVRNLVGKSEVFTFGAEWGQLGAGTIASGTTLNCPIDGDGVVSTGYVTVSGNKFIAHWVLSGTGTVALQALNSSVSVIAATEVTLSSTPTTYTVSATANDTNIRCCVRRTAGDTATSVTLGRVQLEDVTSQTTKIAGEYVSVGVLSAPYHGAGVDGVKYFDTDISGNPIPAATLDGSVVEAAATQYLGVTGTPATQTTASLGTGTYTLWCEGTGSCIASAGTATITGAAAASAGAPDQFEVTVAGTVTVTVTGSLTTFNLTNTPYQTSYIANTGAAGTSTTRNKDVLDDQVSGNITAAAGSVAFQWTPSHAPSGTVALCGSYVDASNYTALLHDGTKYIFRKRIAATNYDAELTASFVSGTTYDIALRWGASGSQIAVDGVLGTAHANTTAAQLGTRWQWGSDGNGGLQAGAAFKEMYLLPRAWSDSELRAMTT